MTGNEFIRRVRKLGRKQGIPVAVHANRGKGSHVTLYFGEAAMDYTYIYPATLTPAEEGGFVVTFRDFPEAITQGEDLSDALAEAADCLEETVAAYLAANRPLPPASACEANEHAVYLPLQTACKAMLAQALRETGVSKSELARRMGIDVREARRMLDPRHPTKVDRMENALCVLGYRPVLHLTAA